MQHPEHDRAGTPRVDGTGGLHQAEDSAEQQQGNGDQLKEAPVEDVRPPFRIVYRRDPQRVRVVRVWRSERLLEVPD